MPFVGNLPGSFSGWESYQSNKVQVGGDGVVPAGYDQLLSLYAYVAREGGPGTITLAAWRGNTIIASISVQANASGGANVGLQSWCGAYLPSPVAITPGETLRIGWQRGAGAFWDWSWASGGSHYEQDAAGAWTGATATGIIGAYGDVGQSAPPPPSYHPSLQINGAWALADGRLRVNGAAARLYMFGVIAQR